MKMAMNAMSELPQPKPRFPYLDRQVSDYMYTVTLADRSRQEQKAASGRGLVAAGNLQRRGSQRQSESYDASQDDHGGHGAGCVLLVCVNDVTHDTKYLEHGAGPVNGGADVPADGRQHTQAFDF